MPKQLLYTLQTTPPIADEKFILKAHAMYAESML